MAGRPREFDTEQALERAMEVFWADGYEAASVQTLLDAMGINRGSMYDTFGDKHALFLAAIEHYGTTVFRCFEQDLACPGPVLECIRRTLRRMGQGERGGSCRGCLATNAIVELAPHDPEVAEASRRLLRRMERAYRSALDRAVEAGEIPRDADTRSLARFLTTTTQGLIVMAKGEAGRAVVRATVDVAMEALGPSAAIRRT
jgi:TetR/AcrR family transcriptional repressor of nem operon